MIFLGRTVSSFTVDVLNKNPEVFFDGEAVTVPIQIKEPNFGAMLTL